MKLTIKRAIRKYLAHFPDQWITGGTLGEKVGDYMKCKDSNVERRCRELFNEGLIERSLHADDQGKKIVWYKSKPAANEQLSAKRSIPRQLSLINNQGYE